MKIIPPGMPFRRALQSGYVGRLESDTYRRWVKQLPCVVCEAQADDPHHPHGAGILKGAATKVPDFWCFPLCRPHHDELHADVDGWEFRHGAQLEHALLTMTRALAEGVLTARKSK